jgi:hypothetical protein
MTRDNHPQPFERFVAAVHRRMVLLRALERLGLCVLGGCAVALLLMPILFTRGEPTGALVMAALGTAAVTGALWGVLSRPTRLAAVTEADRQLHLADLLGTALTLPRDRPPDGMEQSVLALANARCRQATPSAVVLNRLGARSWGGIGLALALVAGLNLLGPDAARSENPVVSGPRSWTQTDTSRPDDLPRTARPPTPPDLRRAKPGTGSDDPDPLRSQVPDASAQTPQPPTAIDPASTAPGGGGDGAGAGSSQSQARNDSGTPLSPGARSTAASSSGGEPAAGGGAAGRDAPDTPGTSAGTTAGGSPPGRKAAPIWRSEGWPLARDAAEAAVRDGRVPDAYRDLVRGYFDRD